MLHNEISEGEEGKNLSVVRQTGCMKEGSLTREGGKEERAEEEAVKIKKPAPLRGFPPRRMLSSFLPSLTHSRGKNEATLHSQGPEIPRPVVIHNYRALHLE